MNAIRLLPVVVSALLIAAHYLRAGSSVLVLACVAAPALLLVRRPWVPRVLQVGLALATAVWVLTAIEIVQLRTSMGASWTVAAVILGCVAAWTAASALVFETRSVRGRFGLQARSR